MKPMLTLALLLCFAALFTSCQKEFQYSAVVVRNCTGTYLRLDGKDYQVCNLEKVARYPEGARVSAVFKKIGECNGSARHSIVCMMIYPSHGWIEVQQISSKP